MSPFAYFSVCSTAPALIALGYAYFEQTSFYIRTREFRACRLQWTCAIEQPFREWHDRLTARFAARPECIV